ncbi:phytanoyl-CoA dioxygenase family protein [Aspergillus saccharolyticus JOP 1030-1]|uniref:PhyH-domain-containing protein n=1 Tax=Aspergillus saccharolyticus JOP 1030-1 TaxID=1450539 RepID=A0A318ZF76_9EURO|nr:PhyH-domain-containing protein [Aspergillus saccharolyticus JOP 1030-1]PYH42260.1 PhyH-domain-containing protein [Aspergillus saccharolyticus JOP 1030-1]
MTETADTRPGVQSVSKDHPLEDIFRIIKRDGCVVVRELISAADVDQVNQDVQERLHRDVEWNGSFFPKETRRAPSMIALSPTYTRTQVMNPLFQAICAHFLTTRSVFWWGDQQKESVSKPYVTSCTAIEVGPGATAQPLHRDSYINHRILSEISEWDDERDQTRETALGMMVAGCKVTRENGGTQCILGSHLWGTHRTTPPDVGECVVAELEKGDALIMLSSIYHGGGNNTTQDERRIAYATFAVRGYLRQEENQYLAVPQAVVKTYDHATQQFIGYSMSDPACGYVEELSPFYLLHPELLQDARPQDF